MDRKIRILLLLLLVCVCILSGCGSTAPPDYFAYRDTDFCTEVRGELNNIRFCAKVTVRAQGTGRKIAVEYLSDAATDVTNALAGVRISATADRNGQFLATEQADIVCNGATLTADVAMLEGLLLPASVLFDGDDVFSVQKTGEGYTLTLVSGEVLTLDAQGVPCSFSSDRITFSVIWWETDP